MVCRTLKIDSNRHSSSHGSADTVRQNHEGGGQHHITVACNGPCQRRFTEDHPLEILDQTTLGFDNIHTP